MNTGVDRTFEFDTFLLLLRLQNMDQLASTTKYDISPRKEKTWDWPNLLSFQKYVVDLQDGSLFDVELLGNKGAVLCELTRMGLPVPPGFILTTDAFKDIMCSDEVKRGINDSMLRSSVASTLPTAFVDECKKAIKHLEKTTSRAFWQADEESKKGLFSSIVSSFTGSGAKWKGPQFPLLVAVRSGSAVPMAGMMDTVLNVGMNDHVLHAIIEATDNPIFAYDVYRRFLESFGSVVFGIDRQRYNTLANSIASCHGQSECSDLDTLKHIVADFKILTGKFPEDPFEQFCVAMMAVFNSWNNPRAISYREIYGLSHKPGCAVTVQSMVYGNLNTVASGVGLCFTRNPCSGEKELFGEYFPCCEGDALADGLREPFELTQIEPSCYETLIRVKQLLETKFRDVQAVEFTIENSVIYILQAKPAQRSALSNVRIAVDMVEEGIVNEREALLRLDANQLKHYRNVVIDPKQVESAAGCIIGSGIGSAPGAATGMLVFTVQDAVELSRDGSKVILCRECASVDDILGFEVCEGLLTSKSGVTCHASALLREFGKVAVTGVGYANANEPPEKDVYGGPMPIGSMRVDCLSGALICCDGTVLGKGAIVTLDGNTGNVFQGHMPVVYGPVDAAFNTVMRWANQFKEIEVLGEAFEAADLTRLVKHGADGIGTLATEYMVTELQELAALQRFILSDSEVERKECMDIILPQHCELVLKAIQANRSKPICIRLLYPSLQHFMPENFFVSDTHPKLKDPKSALKVSEELQELNPLLGCKGGRLSILYPELTAMQTKAIIGAACRAHHEGIYVKPIILIPFISSDHELAEIIPIIKQAACEVIAEDGMGNLEYGIGVQFEVPRACMKAREIASVNGVELVSISTKQLTEMTFGFSKDDSLKLRQTYRDRHVFRSDPFVRIDERGVGSLIRTCIKDLKKANKTIKVGISGDHCGDAGSVHFFSGLGVDYISAAPSDIAVAKVAAAQAHINEMTEEEEARRRAFLEADLPWAAF